MWMSLKLWENVKIMCAWDISQYCIQVQIVVDIQTENEMTVIPGWLRNSVGKKAPSMSVIKS